MYCKNNWDNGERRRSFEAAPGRHLIDNKLGQVNGGATTSQGPVNVYTIRLLSKEQALTPSGTPKVYRIHGSQHMRLLYTPVNLDLRR